MKPSLSLGLRQRQQLRMTPQLRQAIRLLQLSALDLRREIQEALETNPMLEEDSEEDSNAGTDEFGTQPGPQAFDRSAPGAEYGDRNHPPGATTDAPGPADMAEALLEEAAVDAELTPPDSRRPSSG